MASERRIIAQQVENKTSHNVISVKKRPWVWALVLGVAGCFFLLAFFTLGRKEPSLEDHIPMLKGMKPFYTDTTYEEMVGGGTSSRLLSTMRQYQVEEDFEDVCKRLDRELPWRPSSAWFGKSGRQYGFKSKEWLGEATLSLTKGKDFGTLITVEEVREQALADRVKEWWRKVYSSIN